MLVVLAIISVITVVTLVGQSSFDRSMLLTDAAYNVALSAREMQSFGLSSRGYDTDASAAVSIATNIGYGIHVNALTPTRYLAFADTQRAGQTDSGTCPSLAISDVTSPEYKRGDCMYAVSPSADGIFETFTFARGFRISRFCGKNGATTYCSNDSSNPLTALNVVFMRPNTDAIVVGTRSAGAPLTLTSGAIYITSADGTATRGICITQIGQISVSLTTCP